LGFLADFERMVSANAAGCGESLEPLMDAEQRAKYEASSAFILPDDWGLPEGSPETAGPIEGEPGPSKSAETRTSDSQGAARRDPRYKPLVGVPTASNSPSSSIRVLRPASPGTGSRDSSGGRGAARAPSSREAPEERSAFQRDQLGEGPASTPRPSSYLDPLSPRPANSEFLQSIPFTRDGAVQQPVLPSQDDSSPDFLEAKLLEADGPGALAAVLDECSPGSLLERHVIAALVRQCQVMGQGSAAGTDDAVVQLVSRRIGQETLQLVPSFDPAQLAVVLRCGACVLGLHLVLLTVFKPACTHSSY
jgi:hypothetical protein